jgi:hypothetical protein
MSPRFPGDYDALPHIYTKQRIKFYTDPVFFWAVGASIIAVVNGAAVLGLWSVLTACHF